MATWTSATIEIFSGEIEGGAHNACYAFATVL